MLCHACSFWKTVDLQTIKSLSHETCSSTQMWQVQFFIGVATKQRAQLVGRAFKHATDVHATFPETNIFSLACLPRMARSWRINLFPIERVVCQKMQKTGVMSAFIPTRSAYITHMACWHTAFSASNALLDQLLNLLAGDLSKSADIGGNCIKPIAIFTPTSNFNSM